MNKISDFEYLKTKINFSYDNDIEFYAVGASEDTYHQKMLFYLLDLKYLEILEQHPDNIAGIICSREVAEQISNRYETIITDNPKALFFLIHNDLKEEEKIPTIIEDGCEISPLADIAPYNVIIKSGTKIDSFVSIKEGVEIGHNCYIASGSVIGGEGFNVFRLNEVNYLVKHRGKVIIEDNVVILSNACIAKAIYPHISTLVEENAMIDNLVHVGHDCQIRKGAELAAGTITGGFTDVGAYTFMGVNSNTKPLVRIGRNNKIGMGACVSGSTIDNDIVAGPNSRSLKDAKLLKRYEKAIIEHLNEHPEDIANIVEYLGLGKSSSKKSLTMNS